MLIVRRPGIVLTIAIAWVGVVLGHLAAYLLTYPSQYVRHVHLALTGHSWLGLAKGSVAAIVPVLILVVVVRALVSRRLWSGPRLVGTLLAIQIPVFATIEAVERGSVAGAAADPAVFVGLVLQVVLAVVAAWLIEALTRAVLAVARTLASHHPRARSASAPALDEYPPRHDLLLPARRRAPPLLSGA
jgi:hypothetical protein